jgi:hypothetical protein
MSNVAVELLESSIRAVTERRATYGPPTDHFARTVGMLNAMLAHKLREPLTLADWATIMVLDKLARAQHSPHLDNPVDVAGYAACWAECMVTQAAEGRPTPVDHAPSVVGRDTNAA